MSAETERRHMPDIDLIQALRKAACGTLQAAMLNQAADTLAAVVVAFHAGDSGGDLTDKLSIILEHAGLLLPEREVEPSDAVPTPQLLRDTVTAWIARDDLREAGAALIDVNLDDGFITAAMLARPAIARGHCYLAGSTLDLHLEEVLSAGAARVTRVGRRKHAQAKITQHYAVRCETTEGLYVVDLTARQFGRDLPFPLIEPAAEYAARGTWWTSALRLSQQL
jgi:hypothetical protein